MMDIDALPEFDGTPDMYDYGCKVCHEHTAKPMYVDRVTGLCRPCWRIVVLAPAVAKQ